MAHTEGPYIRAPWELRWGDRSAHTPRIVDADGRPVVSFGNQIRHQGMAKVAARANLITAAPELLTACEADAALWDHYIDCPDCKGNTFCIEAIRLSAHARTMRLAAIARVKGDERDRLKHSE